MREINLIRLQAGAGLCFAVFLVLHLTNTMLGVGGLAVLTFAGAFESIPRESWGRFGDVTAAWLGVDLHEL